MTDIVARLRQRAEIAAQNSRHGDENDFNDAADEIERLRAALEEITLDGPIWRAERIAREALEVKDD